jgi:hypothetical protein
MRAAKGSSIRKTAGKSVKQIIVYCDPIALLDRLYVILASRRAGNTGVQNEIVSVCAELRRQGIVDMKYKYLINLI